jgi:signal peptidase
MMAYGEMITNIAGTTLILLMIIVAGQPVLLAFVKIGSMKLTFDPGDGFVAVPSQPAGPVEERYVVVCRAWGDPM